MSQTRNQNQTSNPCACGPRGAGPSGSADRTAEARPAGVAAPCPCGPDCPCGPGCACPPACACG